MLALALLAGTVIGPRLPASTAYLPVIGPAPLRLETMPAPGATWSWKFPIPAARAVEPTNPPAPAVAATTNINSPVNPPVAAALATNADQAPAALTTGANAQTNVNVVATAPPPAILPLAPGDTMTITPQLLADYFKPMPGAENSAAPVMFVPAEAGFTPPIPQPAPESRAVYQTQ